MKKSFIILLRVIFVLIVILLITLFGLRSFFLYESKQAIDTALVVGDAPVLGDVSATFSVVEFFDYRCSHCAVMSALVDEAIADDKTIKIILRPVALIENESFLISSFVLAADKQKDGAGIALHKDIMALGHVPDLVEVQSLARARGINVEQADIDSRREDIRVEVNRNTELVRDIGFGVVPSLVIGDRGYLPRDQMPSVNELKLMILDAKARLAVQN